MFREILYHDLVDQLEKETSTLKKSATANSRSFCESQTSSPAWYKSFIVNDAVGIAQTEFELLNNQICNLANDISLIEGLSSMSVSDRKWLSEVEGPLWAKKSFQTRGGASTSFREPKKVNDAEFTWVTTVVEISLLISVSKVLLNPNYQNVNLKVRPPIELVQKSPPLVMENNPISVEKGIKSTLISDEVKLVESEVSSRLKRKKRVFRSEVVHP